MQYVKVIGNTHAEAMRKLRDTYGPEAIIYYEKEIPAKTVLSRMIGKKQFMIQAALAEKKPPLKKPQPVKTIDVSIQKEPSLEKDMHAGREFLNMLDHVSISHKDGFNIEDISFENKINPPYKNSATKPKNTIPGSRIHTAPPTPENAPGSVTENGHEHNEEKSAKKIQYGDQTLDSIKQEINEINKKISILIKNPYENPPKKDDLADLEKILIRQDFSEKWSAGFIENVKNSLPSSDWKIPEKVFARAVEQLSSRIKTNSAIGTGRVIVLLGATGVGKTTTLAKLAARLKLKENKTITLITLDNFRIAATEQLKVYADILDVPIHVTKDPQKFRRILAEDPADVILVDTSGASQNNREFLLKQQEFFPQQKQGLEKHLVLSATSKPSDAREIIRTFDMFGIDRIVLSKIDESRQYGNFVELAESRNMAFSFFTNGQKVPDDYIPADPEFLARRIIDPNEKWI